MSVVVVRSQQGHRLGGAGPTVDAANRFLEHLGVRGFSSATVRAYAYDLANFAAFLDERSLSLTEVVPTDLFAYLDWQVAGRRGSGRVVALQRPGPAPATMNRRISAVRGLFEHLVIAGVRADNPVPATRRAKGLRTPREGCWDMCARGVPGVGVGWSASHSACPRASRVTTSSRSCGIWRRTATAQWFWPWCWAGYEPERSAHCGWRMSIWGCDGYVWWTRAAASGSSRSTTRSSPSAPPICVKSVRRAARPSNGLWCYAARLAVSR